MNKEISISELKEKAKELRLQIIETTYNAGSGHLGGSLSAADIFTILYFKYLNVEPKDPDKIDRDRFVLSKGHTALGYVPTLALAGFIPMDATKQFNKFLSGYGIHPDSNKIVGCDASTGSLGHGLPMAVGMALGLRYQGYNDAKVVCLMGDGEQHEGSIWEAAMSAHKFKLDNLIAMVDRNKFCIDGPTEDVMPLEPLADKYKAFGFEVIECNGNDMEDLDKAMEKAWNHKGGPICIIANTEKGFGVKRFQGHVEWHYGALDDELKQEAIADIKAL